MESCVWAYSRSKVGNCTVLSFFCGLVVCGNVSGFVCGMSPQSKRHVSNAADNNDPPPVCLRIFRDRGWDDLVGVEIVTIRDPF